HHAVDARLVVERVLLLVEGAELRDVGAGGERLVAGAGDEQRAHRAVLVRLVADLGEALVHRERQRVPRLRAIEGDVADAVAKFVEQFFHRAFPKRDSPYFLRGDLIRLKNETEGAPADERDAGGGGEAAAPAEEFLRGDP